MERVAFCLTRICSYKPLQKRPGGQGGNIFHVLGLYGHAELIRVALQSQLASALLRSPDEHDLLPVDVARHSGHDRAAQMMAV